MDRRTLLAIGLALITYYLWMMWVGTNVPPVDGSVPVSSDGTPSTEAPAAPPVASATQPASPEVDAPTGDSTQAAPRKEIPLRWCDIDSVIDTSQGLGPVTLTDYNSAYEITPLWRHVLNRVTGNGGDWKPYGDEPGPATLLSDKGAGLTVGGGPMTHAAVPAEVVEQSAKSVVLRRLHQGLEARQVLSVREDCTLDVEVQWTNHTGATWTEGLWVGIHDHLPEESSRWSPTARPYGYVDGSVENQDNLEKLDAPKRFDGPVSWFGLADNYFAAFMVPEDPNGGTLYMSPVRRGDDTLHGTHFVVQSALAPGATHTSRFRMYIGPKDTEALKAVDETLGEAVQLGFFGFFGKILLAMLNFFHGWVGDWGLSIICLTLSVKLLFFPLTHKAFKSSQAMAALQPDLQKIREEFKDDPEELNRRMLKLWKDNGVNPLGGCLPTLIQFPVWIALYQVLLTNVDLYHTEFLFLRDLSSVDPYCVLPVVVMGLMLAQQRMMPMGNMDPAQARIMKMMPLIFGIFFFMFPAGLVVYIFVNMVLTIGQQWLIKRTFKPAGA